MNTFKDESTGNWYTQGLFLELSYGRLEKVIYTLKDEDISIEVDGVVRELPAIKRLYLECNDPTEYLFATTYLGGWKHWQRLCAKTTNLHPYIEEWREELEVKLRSQGIKAMCSAAEGPKGQQAAKWLAEKGWVEKTRGAPSTLEKQAELKKVTRIHDEVEDDLLRLIK